MKYQSTRDARDMVSGARAIVAGLAAGGGLYVPVETPVFGPDFLSQIMPLPYAGRVKSVLSFWLPELKDQLGDMCRAAYARFDDPAAAPVRALSGGRHVLELWHGPTLAFKDMALQLMPHLMTASGRLTGETRDILILVATSGDTGKAALEGFTGVKGVRICVFYPEGGVSEAQRLQMVTQEGDNVRAVAVRGNFDDAQTGVKRIFTNPECARLLNERGIVLSSANSINLGRLVPQIAYYVSAYADMASSGAVSIGSPIDICVPTGNFGNILAAHYAKLMGLPVGRLICASNSNNVLTDFIATGVYDKNRDFRLTSSPSMDILISSNLERLLFEISGRDDSRVRGWMDDLRSTGKYSLDARELLTLKEQMWGGWADEDSVCGEIAKTLSEDGYLCDPHTAVALKVSRDYRSACGGYNPLLIASTASPYKFGRSVLGALESCEGMDDFACCERLAELTGQNVPEAISQLRNKPIRHTAICDIDQMWDCLGPMKE